jgi:hypothetical protein
MTDQELVDLLAYLTTLRRPVSIVGQYHVIGPLDQSDAKSRIDPVTIVDVDTSIDDGHGRKLSWRRLDANTEGLVDLTPFTVADRADSKAAPSALAFLPVTSPVGQKGLLALDTTAEATAWLNGKPVPLSGAASGGLEPKTAAIELPAGTSSLLIRVAPGAAAKGKITLVTTLVVDQPVGFSRAEPKLSAATPSPR